MTTARLSLIALLLCLSPSYSKAQTFEAKLPREPFHEESGTTFFTLAVENDSFSSSRDQHYTSGVRASWMQPGAPSRGLATSLLKLLDNEDHDAPGAGFWSLGHNLYTPSDIGANPPSSSDRPYAGFLYGSRGAIQVKAERVDTVELTVGIVGPSALGEPVQDAVHKIVGAVDPQGWDHQLNNELGINVAWERRWPGAFSRQLGNVTARVMPHIGVFMGNVYSHAATGMTLQLLPDHFTWQAPPLRVRPAIPGSGFFYNNKTKQGWSVFTGFEMRAVARNIFLDGNTFSDSPDVEREIFVLDANVGFSFTVGQFRISYTHNWRSREFQNQADPQEFGAVSVGYRVGH